LTRYRLRTTQIAFAELHLTPGPNGAIVLNGAIAWLDVTIDGMIMIGDHEPTFADLAFSKNSSTSN
jgi:hypothetical protein